MSAPPSAGQSVRNNTTYTYFDNGWTETSTDPWHILTTYKYNNLGQQTERILTPAGETATGSTSRTMTWSYHLDGKLAARTDEGVPAGKDMVLVDNSDINNTATTGTWTQADSADGKYGYNYTTHPAGTGTDTFTWRLNVPKDGTYQVYVRYPQVEGAANNAEYTVAHGREHGRHRQPDHRHRHLGVHRLIHRRRGQQPQHHTLGPGQRHGSGGRGQAGMR